MVDLEKEVSGAEIVALPEKQYVIRIRYDGKGNIIPLMTPEQTAGYLQVGKFTIYKLISKGLPAVRVGIQYRIDKKILDMMFKEGLRNLNVGIETIDKEIARKNKR